MRKDLVVVAYPQVFALALILRHSWQPQDLRWILETPLPIEMATTDWCWVAAETDSERVMYRLVERPGEQLVLEGQHLISLRLGDAGAVRLSINDGASRFVGSRW